MHRDLAGASGRVRADSAVARDLSLSACVSRPTRSRPVLGYATADSHTATPALTAPAAPTASPGQEATAAPSAPSAATASTTPPVPSAGRPFGEIAPRRPGTSPGPVAAGVLHDRSTILKVKSLLVVGALAPLPPARSFWQPPLPRVLSRAGVSSAPRSRAMTALSQARPSMASNVLGNPMAPTSTRFLTSKAGMA